MATPTQAPTKFTQSPNENAREGFLPSNDESTLLVGFTALMLMAA